MFEGLQFPSHYIGPENAVVIKTQSPGGDTGLRKSDPSSSVTKREEARLAAEMSGVLVA